MEFLIKDYPIVRDAALKDQVEKKPLAQCIRDHIDRLTVLWIERIEYTDGFIQEMPGGRPEAT